MLKIVHNICNLCGLCQKSCPFGAISVGEAAQEIAAFLRAEGYV